MRIKNVISLLGVSLFFFSARSSVEISPQIDNARSLVITALKLPIRNRVQALQSQGSDAIAQLKNIVLSRRQPYELRWRAVTVLPMIAGEQSLDFLEQCLKHKSWFIRSAGLVAVKRVNQDKALFWAHKLLNDHALVVRSQAVEVMHHIGDPSSRKFLWDELYQARNFRGGQSLWIRRQIVEALVDLSLYSDEKKLLNLLSDSDQTLHKPAQHALQRIRSF